MVIEELLKNILLNQMVIMGGILAPRSDIIRNELEAQIKHTSVMVDTLDSARGSKSKP